ncbi:MAG: ArsC/Spx/MgsR family protein [Thiotrichales bacterium]
MATVIFYEKPGCVNNARQKVLLREAGHQVEARNLLAEPWTRERLRGFFGDLPVAQWFNPSAPRVKSGEVDPEKLDERIALCWMIVDPLLIRRPLMEVGRERRVGFDPQAVERWIGLAALPAGTDLETCPKGHAAQPCANSGQAE